jgi:hypothetical protein
LNHVGKPLKVIKEKEDEPDGVSVVSLAASLGDLAAHEFVDAGFDPGIIAKFQQL